MQPEIKRQVNKLNQEKCNLCKKESTLGYWVSDNHNASETEVYMVESNHYGDSGNGTAYMANICNNCFKEKLIPFLESEGSKVKIEEWDY